jgi:hypothetical protein
MANSELIELFRAAGRDDWDAVDQAVERLDTAGWPGGVQGITAVFGLAVHRRFPADYDVRDVIRFVADMRSDADVPDDIPPTDAEALIRAALGEPALAEHIPGSLSLSLQVALAIRIIAAERMPDAELERFLGEAEALVSRWRARP